MVYIKLSQQIYSKLKTLMDPKQLTYIGEDKYLPYSEFSRHSDTQKG